MKVSDRTEAGPSGGCRVPFGVKATKEGTKMPFRTPLKLMKRPKPATSSTPIRTSTLSEDDLELPLSPNRECQKPGYKIIKSGPTLRKYKCLERLRPYRYHQQRLLAYYTSQLYVLQNFAQTTTRWTYVLVLWAVHELKTSWKVFSFVSELLKFLCNCLRSNSAE